ncbi:hypothetical protein B0H13DRAFT_2520194 [Mycena leptocephala]|nr:hypothetical protein B0H13DRAFT_2520194 [Mycena leptocephala]
MNSCPTYLKRRYRVREAWTAGVGRDYSGFETRRDSIGFALQAQDELRRTSKTKRAGPEQRERGRMSGRMLEIPGEPKRRDSPDWDGVVDLGCHASLGRGKDNERDLRCGIYPLHETGRSCGPRNIQSVCSFPRFEARELHQKEVVAHRLSIRLICAPAKLVQFALLARMLSRRILLNVRRDQYIYGYSNENMETTSVGPGDQSQSEPREGRIDGCGGGDMGQPGNALQRARLTVKVETVMTTQPEKRVGVADMAGLCQGGGGGNGLKTADAGRDVRNRGARDIARKQKARMRGAMRRMRASYHAQCLRVNWKVYGKEKEVMGNNAPKTHIPTITHIHRSSVGQAMDARMFSDERTCAPGYGECISVDSHADGRLALGIEQTSAEIEPER